MTNPTEKECKAIGDAAAAPFRVSNWEIAKQAAKAAVTFGGPDGKSMSVSEVIDAGAARNAYAEGIAAQAREKAGCSR